MIFNSLNYALFLPIILFIFYITPGKYRNYVLLLASYFFYGWWDVRFLFLVALSTTIDYWAGLVITNGQLTIRQRAIPAAFLTFCGIAFLGVDSEKLLSETAASFNGSVLMVVLAGLCGFFLAMALFYQFFANREFEAKRRLYLLLSIAQNLTILGFFKYFDFFSASLEEGLGTLGVNADLLRLDIILPVGVSFYTFQSISYTIEVYKREVKPVERFFDFALFVAYFPQLVAGPISRARVLLPQLLSKRAASVDQISRGCFLIVLGLFKKMGIADGVAPVVDQIFGSSGGATWAEVSVGTLLFAVQIYCDFSGYSDIARGTSKLLGIDLMLNFNLPYFSKNPQEFWQRWHISLSTWLRDYLYIPLGGNRGPRTRVYRNLMLTMVLGGLWHGAAWNYVLWGAYQGLLLGVHRAWCVVHLSDSQQHAETIKIAMLPMLALKISIFFVFTCYGWLLFRAGSFEQIVNFTNTLIFDFGSFGFNASNPRFSAIVGIVLLVTYEIIEYLARDRLFYRGLSSAVRGLMIASMVTVILMGMSNEQAQFIYFQF